ncbi:MAG TPA: DUF6057 family protein [Sedimentisphaerales bacterium]|nr:DUF6057 family protein [Sedimentisphaerales bacterium]
MPQSHTKQADATPKKLKAFTVSASSVSCLLFFLLSFLYLWLVVEPRLIYYCFGTILSDTNQFATGWSPLRDSLQLPGGLVAHIAAFLSVGFHRSWLGAVIIVLTGASLAELTRRHLVKAGLSDATIPALLPAVALFLIYSDYKHPLPAAMMASCGLLLSLLFERLPSHRFGIRTVAFCLSAAVAFWLSGPMTLLGFAVMTVLYAAFLRKDWPMTVLALPAAAGIAWLLSEHLFLLPISQALRACTKMPSVIGLSPFFRTLHFLVYGLAPLALLLTLAGRHFFARRRPKPTVHPPRAKGHFQRVEAKPRRQVPALLAKTFLAVFPTAIMVLGLYFTREQLRKPYLASNYYWHQKQWDKILELAGKLPKDKTHAYVNHDILRALYHTGRLPYDLFRFPLVPEALLLTHEAWESDLSQLKLGDLFLELGHVNMAQKLASELVAVKNYLGPALEQMAWICIVKEQPAAARVYLEALKKDLIRRSQAESLLQGLDRGFTPQQWERITRIRSCLRDETAGPTGPEAVDQWLAALVEHNPCNRMAFEYLMTCYLLTGRVEKIAENLKRLDALGYRGIPPLYEEALVIHYGNLGRLADLAKSNVNPETVRRYETFLQLRYSMRPQNQQAVLNLLIRDFGSSYFFYYSFGRVGVM